MGRLPARRRAVHDTQKEARRQDLLDTAWHLFQQTSYDAVTVADVAAASGLAKGTVFLYFKTKEALFLALLEQQLVTVFAELDGRLAALPGPAPIPQVAAIFSAAFVERPALVRLLAIQHTILERNVEAAEVLRYKQFLLQRFGQTGALLERALAFLRPSAGPALLLQSYAVVIGAWHLADPTPVAQAALQRPELELFAVAFAPTLTTMLESLWLGCERRATETTQPA